MQVKLRIKPSALRASPLTRPDGGQAGRLKFGFSLIELLVVISIIGVLSAVLVTNFMGMRERARDAQKIQDLNSIKNALRSYYNDHQVYPLDQNEMETQLENGNYMSSIRGIGFTYTGDPPSGETFVVKAYLEAGAGTDDTDSQLKCGVGVESTVPSVFMVCAR